MVGLAVRMALHRITALLAVAGAVLGGAALLTGVGVLAESGLRSHLPGGRPAAVDVVVSTEQEFRPGGHLPLALPERGAVPAELLGELAALPGVTRAVADVSFPAALVGAGGRVVAAEAPETAGHGWSSTALLADPRVDGAAPVGSAEIALSGALAAAAGVGVGDRIEVTAAGRPAAVHRVSAVVETAEEGIYFADATAAELSPRGGPGDGAGVDLIALVAEPGAAGAVADAARDVVAGRELAVTTGAGRGDVAAPGAGSARSLLVLLSGSLAGVVLLITGFVLASALSVSFAGQRRELALLRAVGATPRQIRRLAAGQATVVAVVAAVPGTALGYPLAGWFRRLLVVRDVLPGELPLTISPLPAIGTLLLVAVAVQLAARSAAWRASRLPATEAVAESHTEPRAPARLRTSAGLLIILAATVLSVAPLLSRSALGAAATSLAGILGAIGLAMAGPALVRRASEVLARRLRPGVSAPSWLAVAHIRGYALRLAGVVSALAMAVAFVLTYSYAQTTVLAATSEDTRAGTLAQHRVTAPGLGGLPEDSLDALRDTPGVRAAAPVSTTTVVWRYQLFGEWEAEASSALILTPDSSQVLDLGVRAGSTDQLAGDAVAVDRETARSRGAGVGSRLQLVLGDGTEVEAEVVAVYDRGLGFGPLVVSHDLAAGHTSTGLDQGALVRVEDTAEAERSLVAFVEARPGLRIEPAQIESGGLSDAPPEVWINLAVIVVLLAYLLLSIANKIVAITAQRRGELATLRINGTTPGQIRAMVRREAGAVAAAALTAGLALSVIPLALLGQGFLGRPWPAGPGWLLPATALVVTGVAYLTMEIPTRKALRTAPAEVLAHAG
ncbi:FtsX-like permease family protein [Streptomyces sp. DSM 44915]|uniref:FtsX-like permease family protein n=1 Tax=Streptomyces chisholmiae TaxID=3075540 RepID=A0ABU2JY66_9ACTN|nr:FtsX-like permease family protein [Streptomyces sp. DSM 44915]MDT0269679.1 FtsX-like permease family protein [Streptomyces sp. DSM 44915]